MTEGAPVIGFPLTSTYSTLFVEASSPFSATASNSSSRLCTDICSGAFRSVIWSAESSVSDCSPISIVSSVSDCCSLTGFISLSVSDASTTTFKDKKHIERIKIQEHKIFMYFFHILCLIL